VAILNKYLKKNDLFILYIIYLIYKLPKMNLSPFFMNVCQKECDCNTQKTIPLVVSFLIPYKQQRFERGW